MSIKDSSESILKTPSKKLKSNASQSFDILLWLKRLIFYLFLYDILIIVLYFLIFPHFGLFNNDPESARYMLTTLVQSEAAIIAIVITLSLVAVQFAAQSYSPRLIDIFKKTPDLWILIVTYLMAMIYGLSVLKLIKEVEPGRSNLENQITFSFFLGIFSFIILIPYINYILNLLKPSTIIYILSQKITKQEFLLASRKINKKLDDGKNPILPIVWVVRGSLMNHDYETAIDGLRSIAYRVNHMFEIETFEKKEKEEILNDISWNFYRLGRLAVTLQDEYFVIEIIEHLHENCKTAIEENLQVASSIKKLGQVGKLGVENKFETSTGIAINYLFDIGKISVEQDAIFLAMDYLGEIGIVAAEQKLRYETKYAIKCIAKIGIAAAGNRLEIQSNYAAVTIGLIGMAVAEQKHENETRMAVSYLAEIGKAEAVQKFEKTGIAAIYLNYIRKIAAENRLEVATWEIAKYLGEFGKVTAENKLEDDTNHIVNILKAMGIAAVEQKHEFAVLVVINSLVDIGIAAAEQTLELESNYAAVTIGLIGIATAEQKFEDETKYAIKCLAEIGKAEAVQKFKSTEKVAFYFNKIRKIIVGNRLKVATEEMAEYLGEFGKVTAENKMEDVTNLVVKILRKVGIAAAEQKHESAVRMVITSLGHIGIAAAEQKLELATSSAGTSLEVVGTQATKQEFKSNVLKTKVILEEILKMAEQQELVKVYDQVSISLLRINENLDKL